MAQVVCEVSEGLRPQEATVAIEDYHGSKHYLPIDRGMLSKKGGKFYLTVGVVFVHEKTNSAMIEFPLEADSGASRIWVKGDQLLHPDEVLA